MAGIRLFPDRSENSTVYGTDEFEHSKMTGEARRTAGALVLAWRADWATAVFGLPEEHDGRTHRD